MLFSISKFIQSKKSKIESYSLPKMKSESINHKIDQQQHIRNAELQSLLQTNTILIENKKLIYQTKINTYSKQIDKIKKLLENKRKKHQLDDLKEDYSNDENENEDTEGNSDQEQEKLNLKNKLQSISTKMKQAEQKLQLINKIEKQVRITQFQNQQLKDDQNINFNNTQPINCLKNYKQRSKTVYSKKQEIILMNEQNKQNNSSVKKSTRKNFKNGFSTKQSNKKNNFLKKSEEKQWRIKQQQKIKSDQSIERLSLANTIYQQLNKSDQKSISIQRKKRRRTQQQIKVNNFTTIQQNLVSKASKLNNDKYLHVKDSKQNQEQLLLSTSRQNNEKDSVDNCKVKILQRKIQISQLCKNKNGNQIGPTPLSITNSRLRSFENDMTHNNNQKDLIFFKCQQVDPIIQNQYKIIQQQTQNIIELLDSQNTKNRQHKQNRYTIFKLIYENLIRIKHGVISKLNQKVKFQNERQIYINFKQKQQQLEKKLLILKQQESRNSEQLIKIQQQCQTYCIKLQQKQNKYKQISKQIERIQSYKIQVQNNVDNLIHDYQSNLKIVRDDLTSIYQQLKLSTSQRESLSNRILSKGQVQSQRNKIKIDIINNKNCNANKISNILQMYDFIRSKIQAQKMSVLEYKQNILSLQYQLNILKNQEKRCQSSLKECSDIIQKMDTMVKDKQKQCNKLGKQKQRLNKQVHQLQSQLDQYQNLVAIRKNCYNQLQSKYNSAKSKKNKLQKHLTAIQTQIAEKQQKLNKIQTNSQRRQRHLDEINMQIRNILKEKESIVKLIQQNDRKLLEQSEQIKELENLTLKKQQNSKKLDKKIVQFEQKLQKKKQNQKQFQQKIEEMNNQINKINSNLTEKQLNLNHLNTEIKNVQRLLKQMKQSLQKVQNQMGQKEISVKSLNQSQIQIQNKIKILLAQISKLEQVKQQLQQTLVQILQKKQESVKFITIKYQQLQNMELQTERFYHQIEELKSIRTTLITETNQLNSTFQTLQDQINKLKKQEENKNLKLNNLIESIQFNRDEQQNLQERISKLKQIQTKLLIEIGFKVYNQTQKPDQSSRQLSSLLPAQIKQQIQSVMQQLTEATALKQKYNRQKQENRKLRLDNQRLKKIYEMEMNIDDSDVI